MQIVPQSFLDALSGSIEPVFTADAYYDGEMTKQGLPITGGQVSFDASAQVRGTCQLIVNDPDGVLAPRQRTDPLATYGQEINIRAGLRIDGLPFTISLGWFRIQQASSVEPWRWLEGHAEAISSGAAIPIEGRDRGSKLVDFPFTTPEQPQRATVWAEISRLAAGLVPLSNPGFDTSIPAGSIVYGTDRWEAITNLAKLVSAHPVITPEGALTLKLDEPGAPVWSVNSGKESTVGRFSPVLTRAGLRNAVNVQGVDAAGNPITVILTQDTGPLRWGGPFGCVPAAQIVDPLLTTLAAVTTRAKVELAKAIRGQTQDLDIPTVLNYALELEDIVTVKLPRRSGDLPVTKLTMPMRGLMTTTVAMPEEWLISG